LIYLGKGCWLRLGSRPGLRCGLRGALARRRRRGEPGVWLTARVRVLPGTKSPAAGNA